MTAKVKHKKKRAPLILFLLFLVILGIGAGILHNMKRQVEQFDQVIAQNIFVNDVAIGGMTRDEATKALEEIIDTKLKDHQITLTVKGQTFSRSFEALGVTYDLKKVLDQAERIGHEGTFLERYRYSKDKSHEPTHLTLVASYDAQSVDAYVKELLEPYYVAPIDATMERKNRAFHITPEVYGEEPEVSKLLPQIHEALKAEKNGSFEVTFASLSPAYTKEMLKDVQTPLASFHTSYNNADASRNKNLELATKKINTMLLPNEKFKYSDYIEPITEKAGFESSKVILNGELTDGVGGGICQVSTTLYNAILLTDLDIYMRRNHSLPVSYVPLGRDATYATDSVDFQFINNTGHPLYIESYCENNKVYVNLFGHKDFKPKYESKFESVLVEVLEPPAPKYVDDPTLEVGKQVQKVYPKQGKKVELYKLFYQNGELIKRQKINTSIYKPTGAVFLKGTKSATQTTPVTP